MDSAGTQVVSCSSDGAIRLWDVGTQRCVSSIVCHSSSVFSVCFEAGLFNSLNNSNNSANNNSSYNGRGTTVGRGGGLARVISGGKDGNIFITDLETCESTLVATTAFSPATRTQPGASVPFCLFNYLFIDD